jgi:hypothetical protein
VDTDDAAARKEVNTPKVLSYMRLVALENVDGDEDGEDYSGQRDDIWGTMTQAEKDTTNQLVVGIFEFIYGT